MYSHNLVFAYLVSGLLNFRIIQFNRMSLYECSQKIKIKEMILANYARDLLKKQRSLL
jgi:hypothetical protein